MSQRCSYKYTVLGGLCILLASAITYAAPLKVTAIQWVQGNEEIPHTAVNGLPTALQAIAEDGECGGNYQYRWDWNGDGDYDDSGETFAAASSAAKGGYFALIGSEVTYPNSPGDRLYYPKVQVTCGNETVSSVMPVLIRVNRLCTNYYSNSRSPSCAETGNLNLTRQVYTDRAIDRGLWYLFKQMTHIGQDNDGHAAHLCTLSGNKTLYSLGHALNAFLRRGHGHGVLRAQDPYYRHMTQCGIHAMLTTMTYGDVSFDANNTLGESGKGIFFRSQLGISSNHYSSYESTAWVEPIANFGDAGYVSPVGSNATFNRSIQDISQDLADGLVHCMTGNGGWGYSCNEAVTHDASTNGWAPEALRLLERKYGVETYDWAKNNQRNWLASYCPNGLCSYHNGGPKLAGNALVGYGWTEDENFNDNGVAGSSLNAIQSWFTSDLNYWGLYYIYASTKGLRSFVPEITLLPNGTNWSHDFTDFFITGSNNIHSSNEARQANDGSWTWKGNWEWKNYIGTNSTTGLIVQIIQSWLEVWSYARAYPELIGPGAEVTFSHSWSYVLDPQVTIENYKWNVIDYNDGALPVCAENVQGCTDLNGDGDCLDANEMCNEDRNNNGVIDDQEIGWEFETDDPEETFTFVYDAELDWGEEENYNVRLRVTDSAGRYVDDFESVQVTVSKRNNPPTVVAHPDGFDGVYSGYVDTQIFLDGHASFDVDQRQDPYPGDNERPAGIRDSIISIHFDLNLDGDFDDEGEDATQGPVFYNLNQESAIGDFIAIPVRVCDDGQWSNECLDGFDLDDCSMCSFGSAAIRLIENLEPPIIAICTQLVCDDYEAPNLGVGIGVGAVSLDLSNTIDPEGGLNLTYIYELIEGEGELTSDPAYADDPNNMGPRPIYAPFGEGDRVDIIRVTVTDSGGFSSQSLIRVHVPNITPFAGWGSLEYHPEPPQYNAYEVVSLGDGWYRIVVDASLNTDVSVTAHPIANDIQDTFTTYVDMNNDGQFDFTLNEEQLEVGTDTYVFPSGYQGFAQVWSIDDDQAQSDLASIAIDVPFIDGNLYYTFDVNSDGSNESNESVQNSHTFYDPNPQDGSVNITVTVSDENGLQDQEELVIDIANHPPIFEQLVLLEDEWTITFITSAFDVDNDQIRYTFDAGDGSEIQTNRGGIFVHTYPAGNYRAYQPQVTATDSREASVSHTWQLVFEEEVNLSPIIDNITTNVSPGGYVELIVEARDPESNPIEIWVTWGDQAQERERLNGGRAIHQYAYQVDPYSISVEVLDDQQQNAQSQTLVQLEDLPTNIARVQQNRLGDGSRLFSVQAQDPDREQLQYFWDFDGDGTWDEEALLDNIATHRYPQAIEYNARVGIKDPWSGVMAEVSIVVEAEEAPVISAIELTYSARGMTQLEVEAYDPEGSPLTYEVIWGDEMDIEDPENPPVELYTALSNGVGDHRYPYSEDAYIGRIKVIDTSGLSTELSFNALIPDTATEIEGISITQTIGGEVFLRVSAVDADSPGLVYSFDFNDDEVWEVDSQRDDSAVHTYETSGEYDILVHVLDPWSNKNVSERISYVVTPWSESAIAEDHVIGEEGRCIVFRVNPALTTLDAKVDPAACEAEDDPIQEWRWSFGDGAMRWGAEAGHRYSDDGIYLVKVENVDASNPRNSSIQAHIANVAPSFSSDPVEAVEPGDTYVYEVRLQDPGVSDEMRLNLSADAPPSMRVLPGSESGSWTLVWDVPETQPEGPIRVSLIAEDGHTNIMTGEWIADGGVTEQRYWLTVKIGGSNGDNNDNNNDNGNLNGMNGGTDVSDETGEGEFSGGGYVGTSCEQQSSSQSLSWLCILFFISLYARRRQLDDANS
jgi:hypothetical protein